MSRMHNRPHPGEILKEDVLPSLGITVTDAAGQLGVTRVALSRVINGKAGISADMALCLGDWIGNGADIWLRMQTAYDLWRAELKPRPKIKPLRVAA
ncbi:MAG: HigA family addiction module antitoxin [Nevskiales bacterium]